MSAGEERGGGYWPEGEESLDGGGGGTLGRGKETKRKRAPSSSQATRLPRDGARARQPRPIRSLSGLVLSRAARSGGCGGGDGGGARRGKVKKGNGAAAVG